MTKKYIALIFIALIPIWLAAQKTLVLENEHVLAEFDATNGALLKFSNKKTGWNVIERKQLAQSFEMLVPIANKRFNHVRGKEQESPKIEQTANSLQFIWSSLKSDFLDQKLNIRFEGQVTLIDDGLVYDGRVINNDKYVVEYVTWPFVGELTVPNENERFIVQSSNQTKDLYPRFFNEHGYWGVEYPTHLSVIPENSFLLVRNSSQGLFMYSEQINPQQMLITGFELIPGYELSGINPKAKEMDEQLVRMQMKPTHTTYNQPKTSTALKPLEIRFYEGDWQVGADLYTRKKETLYETHKPVAWIGEPANWQKVHASSGNDLLKHANRAKKTGVSVLLVRAWAHNDSKTFRRAGEGFAEAIKECQQMGLKVILELNFTAVDFRSDFFKKELHKYLVKDPHGLMYRQDLLCPAAKGLQDVVKMALDSNPVIFMADGAIINDNNNDEKTVYCFDTSHGHEIATFTAASKFVLDTYFVEKARSINPNFAVLGYGFYDSQQQFYDGYALNNKSISNLPIHRYMNNGRPIISPIDVRAARHDMNKCLKNKYHLAYDLGYHSDDLTNYPQIAEYGKQIESLRNKYKNYIWTGVFNDTKGATVSGSNIEYSVYTDSQAGKKAIVIVNNSDNEISSVNVDLGSLSKQLLIATPENQTAKDFNGNLTLSPLSVAVVMEK